MKPRIRRGPRLPLLLIALGGALLGASSAAAAPLPDLDQLEVKNIGAQGGNGAYLLGFDSEVGNRGPGDFAVHGRRTVPDGPLSVDQLDGAPPRDPYPPGSDTEHLDAHPPVLVPDVGTMNFVDAGTHKHYHFMRFEIYQLRSAANPSVVVNDQKQGFCLTAWSLYNGCGRRDDGTDVKPLNMDMGIPNGRTDKYEAFLEGQSIVISRESTPSGRYVLTHVVDPDNRLRESNESNNASSALVELAWPADPNALPAVQRLESCPDAATCGSQNSTAVQSPTSGSSTQPPGSRPAVDPPRPLSKSDAKALARRAVARRLGRLPRTVRGACRRRAADRFTCGLRWTRRGRSYRAKVDVRYKWTGAAWQWSYGFEASVRRTGCGRSARCVTRVRVRLRSGGTVPSAIAARLSPRPRGFMARQADAAGAPIVPYLCHVNGRLGDRR